MDNQLLQFGLIFLVVFGMLLGLVITPVLPGLVVIWLSILTYGLVTGFTWVSGILFGVVTVLMIIGNLADNYLMGAGARKEGASWLALGVGSLVLLVASFIVTPLGGLLLAVVAVFLVEFARLKDWQRALSSVKGIALGWGGAVLLRMAIGIGMIGLWLIWYLFI